ncbi:Cell division cycle-associated protein 2 [Plecturocebus cupreus]
MPNSQKDCHCLGDGLIENMKESKSQSENVGRIPMESSSVMSCRDRKHRRHSIVSSSLEISLENSELCKDFSDTIDQTFQRRNTKRRTICTFDSSDFGSMSPRRETVLQTKPGMAPPILDQENSQASAAGSSDEPGKRRKSFCASTFANTKAASQSKGYRRRSSLNGKGESSLISLERIEHSRERKQ